MTEIRTEAVPLRDGHVLPLTVGEPAGAVRGGIVVLHEARGVTDAVRRLVAGLASEGWLTVAPHLYHRDRTEEFQPNAGDDEVRDQVSRLDGTEVLADTDTAFGWLAQRDVAADQMGIVGFDLGGSVALLIATQRSLGAAVTVAGGGIMEPLSSGLPSLVEAAPSIGCPWLGLYGELPGSDNGQSDAGESPVQRLRAAAASSGVATDLVTYPETAYRFDSDPDAAADAWQRTLNWFDSHLR
jgi:carboxymethylenebutenolidase